MSRIFGCMIGKQCFQINTEKVGLLKSMMNLLWMRFFLSFFSSIGSEGDVMPHLMYQASMAWYT